MKLLAIIAPLALAGCKTTEIENETVRRSLVVTASVYWQPQGLACERGWFKPEGLTFAHKHLPCDTLARFSHGGRSVVARLNDRGPYVRGRDVDLSDGTARAIGLGRSVHRVTMEILE